MNDETSTVESLSTARGGWARLTGWSPRHTGVARPATATSRAALLSREALRF